MCWDSLHITGTVWITLLKVQEWWHCQGESQEEPHLGGFGKRHWISDRLAKEGRGTAEPSSFVCPVTSVLSIPKRHSWAMGTNSALGPGTAQPLTSHRNTLGWEDLGWKSHKDTLGVIKSSNNFKGFLCSKSTMRAMFSPAAWTCTERALKSGGEGPEGRSS